MNYDPLFYENMWFVYGFQPFVWWIGPIVLAIVFLKAFKYVYWHPKPEEARRWFVSFILGIFVLIAFFVPLSKPAEYLGIGDEDGHISDTQYGETTLAIFVVERLSYGVDELLVSLLGFDVSIQALEGKEAEEKTGDFGTVVELAEPNYSDIIMNFIYLRAEFLQKYTDLVWSGFLENAQQATGEQNEEGWGVWTGLEKIINGDVGEYVFQQIASLLLAAGSAITYFLGIVGLVLCSFLMTIFAVLARYLLYYYVLLGSCLMVFIYAWVGFDGVSKFIDYCAQLIMIKFGVVISIFGMMFAAESLILHHLEIAFADMNDVDRVATVQGFEPGFLYTEAGISMIESASNIAHTQQTVVETLGGIMILMLCLVISGLYLSFKLGSIISQLMGTPDIANDLLTTSAYLTFGLVTLGSHAIQGIKGALAGVGRAGPSAIQAGTAPPPPPRPQEKPT